MRGLYPSQSKIEIDYSMNNQHRIIDAGRGGGERGGKGAANQPHLLPPPPLKALV